MGMQSNTASPNELTECVSCVQKQRSGQMKHIELEMFTVLDWLNAGGVVHQQSINSRQTPQTS